MRRLSLALLLLLPLVLAIVAVRYTEGPTPPASEVSRLTSGLGPTESAGRIWLYRNFPTVDAFLVRVGILSPQVEIYFYFGPGHE